MLVDNVDVHIVKEVKQAIATCRSSTVQLSFVQKEPTTLHPNTGVPQVDFDQFASIAKHHQQSISHDKYMNVEDLESMYDVVVNTITTQNLTRSKLMRQDVRLGETRDTGTPGITTPMAATYRWHSSKHRLLSNPP